MKILVVINKITKTSIPLEMVSKLKGELEITVASFYDSPNKEIEILTQKYDNVNFILCGASHNFFKGVIKLKKITASKKFDVVHTHHTLSGSVARIVAKNVPNLRVIHTVHAEHDSYSQMQNLIIGSTLRYSNIIVGNSANTLEGLKGWQKRLIKNVSQIVIYNGVDSSLIQETPRHIGLEILREHGIDSEDLIFGTVGRLVAVKNQLGIIKGFKRFLESGDNKRKAWLLFIGDGPERLKLQNFIEENPILDGKVIFLGLQDREVVFSLLKHINLFVMASYHEGFCNALMEALVSGVPTLVSNINIFKELMMEQDLVTFDPYESNEIGDLMLKASKTLDRDEDRIRRMKYYMSKFDIEVCAQKYAELYRAAKL